MKCVPKLSIARSTMQISTNFNTESIFILGEISNKMVTRKSSYLWKWRILFQNNQESKAEITTNFLKYFEVKNTTHTTHQNLQDTAKKSGLAWSIDLHTLDAYITKSKQVTQIQTYITKSISVLNTKTYPTLYSSFTVYLLYTGLTNKWPKHSKKEGATTCIKTLHLLVRSSANLSILCSLDKIDSIFIIHELTKT